MFILRNALWGDKVSMLIHAYLHKLAICNHQADNSRYVMSDLVICRIEKSMVIHDTEFPYWDQVPDINQYKAPSYPEKYS